MPEKEEFVLPMEQRLSCFEGCTNIVVKGGVCVTHGAKQKAKKRCNHEGCTNGAIKGGICWTHGAKRELKHCSF
jgi:hypothetical protein